MQMQWNEITSLSLTTSVGKILTTRLFQIQNSISAYNTILVGGDISANM